MSTMTSIHHVGLWRHGPCSAAFSMVEVMVASTVLALGLVGVLGSLSTVQMMRASTHEEATVNRLLASISERFQTVEWTALRTAGEPWSLGRYYLNRVRPGEVPLSANDVAYPLHEAAVSASNSLMTTVNGVANKSGFLSAPSGLRNLEVWFEWYRGTSFDINGDKVISPAFVSAGQSAASSQEQGLLDSPMFKPTSVPGGMGGLVPVDSPLLKFYVFSAAPNAYMDSTGAVMVRIVVTWNSVDGTFRHREAFLARRG